MHGTHFAEVRLCDVDVQGLGLVNECSSVSRLLQHSLLRNLPDGLVQLLDGVRNTVDAL